MDDHSYMNQAHAGLVEEMYRKYQQDEQSVEASWRHFFRGFDFARQHYPVKSPSSPDEEKSMLAPEFKVLELINDYRTRGHLFTKTNPVRKRRQYSPTLDIENFGLSKDDMERPFQAGSQIGLGKARLKHILGRLEDTYCQSIGSEYMFIRNTKIKKWLKNTLETKANQPDFTRDEKRRMLSRLNEAVVFEKFIHKKFPGQKRFSLEGAESLIPALDAVIEYGANQGAKEFVVGMAHRGRLNVLTNILKKPYRDVFSEFAGKEFDELEVLGDVKYHLGHTWVRDTGSNIPVKLTLSPNPSHLEAVNPVVQGIVRARLDQKYEGNSQSIVPVLIHGDASISGQGVVYEVAQMSGLKGYGTGGSIHLIINNQLGFTTSYLDGRTSTYCTDVAKVTQSPVFHVNGDDVEAVTHTIKLALEFRKRFERDVYVDLLCYRKYGHNESDEPRFTQPLFYKIIEKHPDPYTLYKEKLVKEQVITPNTAKAQEDEFKEMLEKALEESRNVDKVHISSFLGDTWKDIPRAKASHFHESPHTGVSEEKLMRVARQVSSIPEGVTLFRKLQKLQNERHKMVEQDRIDWGMAEMLAYGTLLTEGVPVRLSGQDTQRGTFSHRHAVLKIPQSEDQYVPLENVEKGQAPFEVYNSPLSEYGVMGFEYGYALASPYTLTVWEAQFGDFNNGGQVIIDQFLSSAEEKWNVMNDLVMLLPHGYEGQGPEHSSARMERFLTLAAERNMQIVNPTTPANFFHVLRRQLKQPFRKPLVVFTPKSLLRHPEVISPRSAFTKGKFREIVDDPQASAEKVNSVVLVSGKLYYEIDQHRQEEGLQSMAIVRLEQIYPLPYEQLSQIMKKYHKAKKWIWAQEEPGNMGAWQFIRMNLPGVNWKPVTRPDSGSPATGSPQFHKVRQKKIIEKVFGECDCSRLEKECRMTCAQREELIELEKKGQI